MVEEEVLIEEFSNSEWIRMCKTGFKKVKFFVLFLHLSNKFEILIFQKVNLIEYKEPIGRPRRKVWRQVGGILQMSR